MLGDAAKHAKGMSLRDDAILPSPIVADIIHRICQAKGIGVSFYLRFRIILNIGFSPKASGFYPFADATDLKEVGVGDVV